MKLKNRDLVMGILGGSNARNDFSPALEWVLARCSGKIIFLVYSNDTWTNWSVVSLCEEAVIWLE